MTESRQVYDDADALARAAALELLREAEKACALRGRFILALSGGSTPRKLYSVLANDARYSSFPWATTHLFFGDERHVSPGDAESNFRMVDESLLRCGRVPMENVHRVHAELPDADQAAADYEVELRSFFPEAQRVGGFPRFDVTLLGMGPDGHTASLFPGTDGLRESTRWVISNYVEKFRTNRITFTFPVLNMSRETWLLVAGADKADMMLEVLGPDRAQVSYPVQRVVPGDGKKRWLLDRAAAAKLPKS